MQKAANQDHLGAGLLAGLLKLRQGEGRLAGLGFFQSMMIGLPRLFTMTLGNALFLASFSAAYLPLVYLGSAILNPFLGAAYLFLEKRISFRGLQNLMNLVLTLACASFAILLFTGAPAGLVGAGLLVWLDIEWTLTNLILWGSLNRICTVEQSKRLYGLIGSGEILVMVLGGILAGPIIAAFGAKPLVLFSLVGFLASFLGINALLSTESATQAPEAKPLATKPSLIPLGFAGLVILFFGVSQYGVYYFGDTLFYMELSLRFPLADDLAVFLSRYFTLLGLVTLFFKLLLTGRILPRLGLGKSLILSALAMGLGGLAVALASTFGFGELPAAVGLRFAQALLFSGLFYPAFYSLLQPLPARERSRVQTQSELIIGPLIGVGASGLLFLLTGPAGFQSLELGIILALSSLLWILFCRKVFASYKRELDRAVDAQDFASGKLDLDQAALAQLARGLESERPELAELKLSMLENAGYLGMPQVLRRLASHGDSSMRRAAYRRLDFSGLSLRERRALAQAETDRKSLYLLTAMAARAGFAGDIPAPDPTQRLILHFARLSSEAPRELAGLLRHPAAQRILRMLAFPELLPLYLRMPRFPGLDALIQSYGALALDSFKLRLEELISGGRNEPELGQENEGENRREHLRNYGPKDEREIDRLIPLLARSCGESAALLLLETGLRLRGRRLLRCLDLASRVAGSLASEQVKGKPALTAGLFQELSRSAAGLFRLQNLHKERGLLSRALAEEADRRLRGIFQLCGILYPGAPMEALGLAYRSGMKDHQALALERLETLVDKEVREQLLPILLPGGLQLPTEAGDADYGPWTAYLMEDPELETSQADWQEVQELGGQRLYGQISLKLADIDFFRNLSSEQRWIISTKMKLRQIPAGTEVIRQGDQDRSMYVAVSGKPAVLKNGKLVVHLPPGSVIGEFSALDPAPRSATVVEEAGGVWLELTARDLHGQIQDHPELGWGLLRALVLKTEKLGARSVLDGAILGPEQVPQAGGQPSILERASMIRALPLFSRLRPREIITLAASSRLLQFREGEKLWNELLGLDSILILWNGRLRDPEGGFQILPIEEAVLGQTSVFLPLQGEAATQAATKVEGLSIERRLLEAGMLKDPGMLLRLAAPYLDWLRRRV